MMRLNNLRPRPGAKHRTKRLGIGESSGHGKTSGKGHKGQKARSGGSIRLGFEGGQMPLIRRLPKRGFNNAAFHKTWAIINLDDLNEFEAGTVINEQMLRASKHVRGKVVGLKILGRGELNHRLTIEADRVSDSVREKIEKAGGTVKIIEPRPANGQRHPAAKAKAVPAKSAPKARKKPAAKKKKKSAK